MTTCPMCHDPLAEHASTIVDGREVLECRSVPRASKDTALRAIAEMRQAIAQANNRPADQEETA